jgi:magnesium-transporting ATPase (P-type)
MGSEKPEKASTDETPFSVHAKTGLSSAEVKKKLQQYGPNEIPEKKLIPFASF